jgi:hypothetical protein
MRNLAEFIHQYVGEDHFKFHEVLAGLCLALASLLYSFYADDDGIVSDEIIEDHMDFIERCVLSNVEVVEHQCVVHLNCLEKESSVPATVSINGQVLKALQGKIPFFSPIIIKGGEILQGGISNNFGMEWDMTTFWLSFNDPDAPANERFLGVAIFDMDGSGGELSTDEIVREAWHLGIKLGGSECVQVVEC